MLVDALLILGVGSYLVAGVYDFLGREDTRRLLFRLGFVFFLLAIVAHVVLE